MQLLRPLCIKGLKYICNYLEGWSLRGTSFPPITAKNIVILVGKKENVNYGEKAKEEIKFQV